MSEPTVIFGTPSEARLTILSLKRAFSLGYAVVGVLCSDAQRIGQTIQDVPILGGLELVPELSQRGVATLLAWDDSSVMAELAHTQTLLRHMVFIREDRLFPVERVKVRNLGGVLGIEFSNELLRRPNQFIKRFLDLILGTAGLVIALPIVALCASLIKLVSPGPVFFDNSERDWVDESSRFGNCVRCMWTQSFGWPSFLREIRSFDDNGSEAPNCPGTRA